MKTEMEEEEVEEKGKEGGLWEKETGGMSRHVRTPSGKKKTLLEFKVKNSPPTPGEVGREEQMETKERPRLKCRSEETPQGKEPQLPLSSLSRL